MTSPAPAGPLARLGRLLGMSPEAGRRAVVTLGDQCFASGTNFVVGVAVARLAGAAGLGAFSLAYTGWVLLNTLHRSLVTDPMAISGDTRGADPSAKLRQGFGAEVYIGLAATAFFAGLGGLLLLTGQRAFGEGLLAVAPWLTVLDLQDYWRWIGFMQGRPHKALTNDVLFAVAQGLAFVVVVVTGVHSVFAVVSAWGAGALAGALWGLRQFSVRPALRSGWDLLRERWHMSRWLAGNTVVNWAAGQLYLILAAAMLGPAALGGIKSAQNLVTGPSAVVIHAGGSFGLPEASRSLEERGWRGLRRVVLWISAAGLASIGAFGVAILIDGGGLLRLVYGPEFGRYATAARVMAVAYMISGVGLGPILTLKATKRTRALFNVQVLTLVVSLVAVAGLAAVDGVTGAAWATLVAAVANTGGLLWCHRAARRSLPDGPLSAAAPAPPRPVGAPAPSQAAT